MSARAYAIVDGEAATYTAPDGHSEPLRSSRGEDIRHAVLRRATDEARKAGEPVELLTSGDRGRHHLLVYTDGTLAPVDTSPAETTDTGTPITNLEAFRLHGDKVEKQARQPEPEPDRDTPTPAPRVPRASFIETPSEEAQPSMWRRILAATGLDPDASPAAQERRRISRIAARQWSGCRTIAVANGKGGVGKTMTTAMIAAVLARTGGGNVLAWDNNDTRGTLGWRTEPGLYDTTIRDLRHHAENLLSPTVGVAAITRYVHHQPDDRYDVLRSNPELLAADQRLTRDEFDQLIAVAARFYRVVVFDSGNDESADRWLRMVDSSYQLLVPTLATPESAESAALLLDALRARDAHSQELAQNAVVVVTLSEPTPAKYVARVVEGFTGQVRAVEVIPFDPALKSGPLRFDALRPRTRHAWMRTTAATVEHL